MMAATTAAVKPARHVPQRTCVACRTTGGKKGLLRVVRPPQTAGSPGEVQTAASAVYDATGKKNGRGAYVCASIACVNLALKQKKLERALKAVVPEETVTQLKEAAQAADEAAVEPEPGQAERAQKAI